MKRLVAATIIGLAGFVGLTGIAGASPRPHRLHAVGIIGQHLPSPGCPAGCYSGPATAVAPVAPVSNVQNVGDCERAATYIAANGAPGEAVVCPYSGLPAGKAATTLGHTIYIENTNCAAAYENEAWNSHGWSDDSGFTPYRGIVDPFGPCYVNG